MNYDKRTIEKQRDEDLSLFHTGFQQRAGLVDKKLKGNYDITPQ